MLVACDESIDQLPNRVEIDSEASRKSEVAMALSLLASMGTCTKLLFSVSNQVPPGGYAGVLVSMIYSLGNDNSSQGAKVL